MPSRKKSGQCRLRWWLGEDDRRLSPSLAQSVKQFPKPQPFGADVGNLVDHGRAKKPNIVQAQNHIA